MHPRIAITGLGLTTSLGVGVEENWRRLVRGESGVRPLRSIDVSDYPVKDGGEDPPVPDLGPDLDAARRTPELRHLLHVCLEACGASGDSTRGALARRLDLEATRIGLAVGSSLAASTVSEAFFESRRDRGAASADYGILRGYHVDDQFRFLQDGLGIQGASVLVSNACAAGAGSVARASDWIRAGRCDAVIAAGLDAFSVFTFAGFGSLMALSTGVSRPFAAGRDGMKIGAGYAALLLEPLARVLERGDRPLALLAGYGESSDAHHLTHPHPEGDGAVLAMGRALEAAGLAADAIDAINCHATATPSNDAAEVKAMARVFGESLKSIPLYTPKPAVGHALGGAGTVEAILSVLFLREQCLAPSLGVGEVDPALEVELDLCTEARDLPMRYVMSNSFGFGGSNASLIFERFESPDPAGGEA